MSDRCFALIDFTQLGRGGCLRLCEAGRTFALARAVAHAAAKREFVAKQQPAGWTPPSMFRPPEVFTEAEVVEAGAELKALSRRAPELVEPRGGG